jgi:anti-sigma B factor antagonist
LARLVCSAEECGNATVVHVRGELDLASAPVVREALVRVLAASPSTHLIVDLGGVEFIDSTGIGVLVGAHQRVTANGGWFTAVVTTPAVRKALQMVGLLRAWRVTGSVEDALADV